MFSLLLVDLITGHFSSGIRLELWRRKLWWKTSETKAKKHKNIMTKKYITKQHATTRAFAKFDSEFDSKIQTKSLHFNTDWKVKMCKLFPFPVFLFPDPDCCPLNFFLAGKLNYLGWWLLAEAGGIEELRRIPWCCSNIFFSKIRFSRSIFSWVSLSTAVGRLLLLGDLDLGFRSDIWATTTKDLPKSAKSK